MAIFGIEHPTDDLQRRDHVLLDLEPGRVGVRVVDRNPVHHVGDFVATTAAEVAIHHTGLKVHDLGEIHDRQIRDLPLVNHRRCGGTVALNEGSFRHNGHFLPFDHRLAHPHVDGRGSVRIHLDVRHAEFREADVSEYDGVEPRIEVQQLIEAVHIRYGSAGGAVNDDLNTGQRFGSRICDCTDDLSLAAGKGKIGEQ